MIFPDLKTSLLWALGLGLAAALATAGIERTRGASARTEAAKARQELAEYRSTQAEIGRLAERAQRTEEQRRIAAVTKEATSAQTQTASLDASLPAARAASDGVRDAASGAAGRARASACPVVASKGKPGIDSLGVLVDVLGRADKRAGELAEYADRLRIAGIACERSYDALTAP